MVQVEDSGPSVAQRISGRLLAGLAIGAVAAAILPAPLHAQDSSDSAENEPDAVIVVTGSTLRRATMDSPIPVNTVSAQDIADQGVTTAGDILRELPSVGLGGNRYSDNGVGAPQTLGTSLVNLRFLGADRTLTLVNGRRHIGSISGSTAVDVDSIPTALIERIEISTGGASVAYGADAVAGVVNIITSRDFSGLQLDARIGDSDEGGAAEQAFELTGGMNFSEGRGNLALNVGYSHARGLRGTQREWLRRAPVLVPNANDTGPDDGEAAFILADNGRFWATNFGGIYLRYPFTDLANQYSFDSSNNPVPYDLGTVTGGSFNIGGGGVSLADLQTIANPRERYVGQAMLTYEFSDKLSAFLDGKFYRVKSSNVGQPTADFYSLLVTAENPYLPVSDPGFLNWFNGGFGFALLSRFHSDLGFRTSDLTRDTYRIVGGFEGKLFDNSWDWSLSYQYGHTSEDRYELNSRIEDRFALATDPVRDATGVLGAPGAIVCRQTLLAGINGTLNTTASEDVRLCQPLNIFAGIGKADPGAIDYVHYDAFFERSLSQHVVSANVGGPIFVLPYGPVQVSLGGEYRKERAEYTADPLAAAGRLYDSAEDSFGGTYEVKEAFAEIAIPLLGDLPLVHDLTIEGGVRVSDYNTIGTTVAWRASASYAPAEWLRFRATRATAIRAPNINELFTPQSSGAAAITDPCSAPNINLGPDPARRLANCQAELGPLGLTAGTYVDPLAGITKSVISGGNPTLAEEKADSLTVGAVLSPKFLPGFSASIDYFKIDLTNAISSQSAQSTVSDCYDRFDTIENPLCAAFDRLANGTITDVLITTLNLAGYEVRGVDFDIDYRANVGTLFGSEKDFGELGIGIQGTYLDRLFTRATLAQTLGNIDDGEYGSPHWRFNTSVSYLTGPLRIVWNGRFIGGGVEDVQIADLPEQQYPYKVGDVLIQDLQVRYDLELSNFAKSELFFGVNNFTNKTPPLLTRASSSAAGPSALYDPLGRYFYAGLKFKL